MPLEEKARRSKLVIDNNGSLEELQSKVMLAIKQLHDTHRESSLCKLPCQSLAADDTAARCTGAGSQWCAEAAQHLSWAAQQPAGHRFGTDGSRAQLAPLCSSVLAQAMARASQFCTNTLSILQYGNELTVEDTSSTAAGYNTVQ